MLLSLLACDWKPAAPVETDDVAPPPASGSFSPDGEAFIATHERAALDARISRDGLAIGRLGSADRAQLTLTDWGRGEARAEREPNSPVAAACIEACTPRIELERPGLVEWWESREEGIEHGFDVDNPGGSGPLRLTLRVEGARVVASGTQARFRLPGGTSIHYDRLVAIDAVGRDLPATLEVVGEDLQIVVDVEGAAWPIEVDPTLSTGWHAFGDLTADEYGTAMAIAGDVDGDGYADVIVGAPEYYESVRFEEGGAFLYEGSASGPSDEADWTEVIRSTWAHFGSAVAAAGDVDGDGYDDVIIGAEDYEGSFSDEGCAFVYAGSSGGLGSSADWSMPGGVRNAHYGSAVDGAGDVNGDGYDDVIVGAYLWDDAYTDEGIAAVYLGSSTGLSRTATWSQTGAQKTAYYGYRVAGAGDVNGDSFDDIAVSAPYYDDGNTNEGVVFVYWGSAMAVSTTPDWSVGANQNSASLGWALDGAGDVNGDSFDDLLIGAKAYDDGQTDEGVAWVFYGSNAGLSSTPDWTYESDQANAAFGSTVSAAGDVDGDRYDDIVVGTSAYDGANNANGQAWIFHGDVDGLDAEATTTFTDDRTGSEVAEIVSGGGDVDGDGYDDVLVGTRDWYGHAWILDGGRWGASWLVPWELRYYYSGIGGDVSGAGDVNGDGYGDAILSGGDKAYIHLGSADGISETIDLTLSGASGSYFGNAVDSAGDVNGDGFDDVIVGAYSHDGSITNSGAAFVYYGSASGLDTSTYSTIDNSYGGSFGYTVAGVGDVDGDGYDDVAVGAYLASNGQTQEGVVWVFRGSSSGIVTTALAQLEGDNTYAQFGKSIDGGDVDGDGYADVIVGSPEYHPTASTTDDGRTYVFSGSPSGTATIASWTATGDSYATCGQSAVSAGDVDGDGDDEVLVGCPMEASYDYGYAYLYAGSPTGPATTETWSVSSGQQYGYMGRGMNTLGDINGDGYADVELNVSEWDSINDRRERIVIYLGSASGISSASYAFYTDDVEMQFAATVAGAGDLDGDGRDDFLATAPDADTVYVFSLQDDDGDGGYSYDDCDDEDDETYSGAVELCDGKDNDCDDLLDETTPTWYRDLDADGFGDSSPTVTACDQPAGYVSNDEDCDDADAAVNPDALEVCDSVDNDCDGTVDGAGASSPRTYYADADGDGWGDNGSTTTDCSAPAGYVADNTDCDDANAAVSPDADESCNGLDDDCDGSTDEDEAIDAAIWYLDADADGSGSASATTAACALPSGYSADALDCNDLDASVSPTAAELCDGIDQDCDGAADDGALTTSYVDTDADGYGKAAESLDACTIPARYVTDNSDCDDDRGSVNPAGAEVCNGMDDDCDGVDDDGVETLYAEDGDGDGFGSASGTTISACAAPAGYALATTDCDDAASARHPGATETCDGVDENCDGVVDEGMVLATWHADADADGLGDPASTVAACVAPASYLADGSDCDDTDSAVADGIWWWADDDGDGYGDPTDGAWACAAPAGRVLDDTDCDDADGGVHPGQAELWYDGVDADCAADSDYDQDGDGFESAAWGGEDCLDTDTFAHPGASETWYDGIDADCSGDSDQDQDGDGQDAEAAGGTDCNDRDASVYAGAADDPSDGRITDCDAAGEYDADADGYVATPQGGDDCDDANAGVNPGATEAWYDGVDQDCDGNDADQDGDGVAVAGDCDDLDATSVAPCPANGPDDAGTCGCGSGPAAAWLGWLLVPLLRRRTR